MPNLQSFLRGELRQNILSTDSAPFDLKVSVVPDLDNQYLTIDPDTDSEEIFFFTTRSGTAGTPGTVHVTARGFKSYDATTDVGLQFDHNVNAPFKGAANHILLNDKLSQADGGIIADTKSLGFGASAYIKTTDDGTSLKFKDGSNSETTLSDILSLTGVDGKLLNSSGDTTRGFLDDKLAVSGTGLSKTKTDPGANESSTLSLVIASTAEAQEGTDDEKVMTAKKVKDSIDQFVGTASESVAGKVQLSTESELLSGSSSVVPASSVVKAVFGKTITPGTAYVAASSDGYVYNNPSSYTKLKEIVCNLSGTWTVSFDGDGYSSIATYLRIYKNGVALGTERNLLNTDWTTYSESFAFVSGDAIQLYGYSSTPGAASVYARNFRVQYDLVDNFQAKIASLFSVNL